MSESKIEADPLFVGITRPPQLFGVSYMFFVVNALICMVSYIGTSQFRWLLLSVPIHMVGWYLTSKEPLFIQLFKIRAEKCLRSKNRFFHGANSYDPK